VTLIIRYSAQSMMETIPPRNQTTPARRNNPATPGKAARARTTAGRGNARRPAPAPPGAHRSPPGPAGSAMRSPADPPDAHQGPARSSGTPDAANLVGRKRSPAQATSAAPTGQASATTCAVPADSAVFLSPAAGPRAQGRTGTSQKTKQLAEVSEVHPFAIGQDRPSRPNLGHQMNRNETMGKGRGRQRGPRRAAA
jgi:hypothetical protein